MPAVLVLAAECAPLLLRAPSSSFPTRTTRWQMQEPVALAHREPWTSADRRLELDQSSNIRAFCQRKSGRMVVRHRTVHG